jgi:hypothetical protein
VRRHHWRNRDICSTAGNAIDPYGERIATVVRQFSGMKFDPADRDSIRAASEVFAAVLYLGRQIFGTLKENTQLVDAYKNTVFMLFTVRILKVDVFHSMTIY